MKTFFSPSSELAARLQEAENAAAEEERQEGESGGGHGQAQGQAIGPRSNKDKKVETIFLNFFLCFCCSVSYCEKPEGIVASVFIFTVEDMFGKLYMQFYYFHYYMSVYLQIN